jgi:hypothetical protein
MAIHFIRRWIHHLPEGTIFTTRDCLIFGLRNAVDQALFRLVRDGWIRRLARGVFAKDTVFRKVFTDFEIVKAKAEAFGRRIVLQPLFVVPPRDSNFGKRPDTLLFYVEGHSSSFRIGDKTVHLRKIGQRKVQLAKTKVGEAARSLWHLGEKLSAGEALLNAIAFFTRTDNAEFRRQMRWMPAWISDRIEVRHWEKSFDTDAMSLLNTMSF